MTVPLAQKRLLGKVYIKATLVVETGLHIGGGEGKLDIGGIDKLVVREPITKHPYLPGSSIKGKLRSILERFLNKPLNRDSAGVWRYESDDILDGYTEITQKENKDNILVLYQGSQSCELSRLFGATGKDCWLKISDADADGLPYLEKPRKIKKNSTNYGEFDESGEEYVKVKGRNTPARLIVRDSHLLQESIKKLEKIDTGLFMTERKFENGLDRITAAATPRQFERVPKGARFDLEMIYSVEVENKNEVKTDLINIALTLAMLEDDALGGHGSRGYGKVKFENFVLTQHKYSLDESGGSISIKSTSDTNPNLDIKNTTDLFKQLDTENSQLQQLLQISEAQETVAVK
ncbi:MULTISPECIES: type III-A CRISPR-associated RAMP protein Csm3 [Nostocales]|uniref:CRISPR system Cms endoribonuclease Csm3 n=3 Tax=Nostocales TaxID=1161 RepID=A0A8S9TG93_9CYAN|nr:type III-A CRISPR-associated RAMP protein Csm3 [Tolypothrix bouteillei]KAF3890574.1 type III-A CRISPR-associated RAMP protein Csm3 [Tolypothrix bouteillei VB521301]